VLGLILLSFCAAMFLQMIMRCWIKKLFLNLIILVWYSVESWQNIKNNRMRGNYAFIVYVILIFSFSIFYFEKQKIKEHQSSLI
jgi:hypothetical protein